MREHRTSKDSKQSSRAGARGSQDGRRLEIQLKREADPDHEGDRVA